MSSLIWNDGVKWNLIFPCFHFCLHLTFISPPPYLTFQPWRNLEAILPPRHRGSHLTRSITLCLFQLKLTPFAVKSMVIPCRKVTHPCFTHCPQGLSVSGCILCCYKRSYTVRWLSKGWPSKAPPVGKCVLGLCELSFTPNWNLKDT